MSKLIIANWKSHKLASDITEWWQQFTAAALDLTTNTVCVAPPLSYLTFVDAKRDSAVELAAQDVSPYPFGKYTGEVTAAQLKDCGVTYCIVGHSERRQHFGETESQVAQKVTQLLEAGITPVVCIDTPYLESQAAALSAAERAECVVVYEPLAAIGSGNPAHVGDVERVLAEVREAFGEVPVLYGGSVTERDVQEFLLVADGVLVGTASLDGAQFAAVVAAAAVHN